MKIVFDAQTLSLGQANLVTAVVYFDFEVGRQFPMKGWNDFVVVIAAWWLDEFHQLSSIRANAKFSFMDGPYWIEAIIQDTGTIALSCVEDRTGFGIVYEAIVTFDELKRALLDFAGKVSRACETVGLVSKDLDDMRMA